jgi:hypothetical protein
VFRLGAIGSGGKVLSSGNLSFTKINSVGWMSGSWNSEEMGFKVLTVANMKMIALWDLLPCSLFEVDESARRLHGDISQKAVTVRRNGMDLYDGLCGLGVEADVCTYKIVGLPMN